MRVKFFKLTVKIFSHLFALLKACTCNRNC